MIAHLWQSTLVIGIVWLMTHALRGNRARVRYWLWTAASVKFLVPFSWLVSLGARFEWRTAPAVAQPAATFVMDEILSPPVVSAAVSAPAAPPMAVWPWVLASVWVVGFVGVLFWWWRQWRLVRAALREARPIELGTEYDSAGLTVTSSPWTFEPGVVGIWRPVLLLPDGLTDRLTPAQLHTVIAHERCHIRSHDNLAAAVHMLVEAIFWFHPLVWWIERRLIVERERACDETVLRAGTDPDDYAEGILTVCRFTLRAPLACVAGVSGADLRTRIESIVRRELGTRMTLGRRVAVALVAGVLIGVPIMSGVVGIAPLLAVGQEPSTPVVFEVASVKPNTSGLRPTQLEDPPGGRFVATNAWLKILIQRAYGILENQLVGAPDWTGIDSGIRYDINARLEQEPPAAPPGQLGARRLALRSLLVERFKLAVHRETRQVPMYALVLARADGKPGPMLTPASGLCLPENAKKRSAAIQAGKASVCGTRIQSGRIQHGGSPLADFARGLSDSPWLGRSVVDRTGLTGNWDLVLTFTPDRLPSPGELSERPASDPRPVIDPDGPSLFTALQDQLGLKLESIRGPMEVLVVDRVERLDAQDAFDPRP